MIETVIVNSSGGKGIIVSIDHGKRTEFFMNSPKYWFYASEIVVDGPSGYYEWELKAPGLGDLRVYRKSWTHDSKPERVASFPKATWEYARLLVEDEENDNQITNSNDKPEKKLKISKVKCKHDHLVSSHELNNHNLEIHDLAECSDCDYECAGTIMLAHHIQTSH